MAIALKQMLEVVVDRTSSFLKEEIDIEVKSSESIEDINLLKLRHLTTLVTIGGDIYVAFSFDEKLMDQIFVVYTEDVEIEPDERQEYLEETAGDVINIIIGNAAANFEGTDGAIQLSPPMMIPDVKRIVHRRGTQVVTCNLHTDHGDMSINCIASEALIGNK